MTTRLQVELVTTTPKAVLVRDANGREGWLQRRWLATDNTVAAETFERAVAHAAQRKAEVEAGRAFRAALHPLRAVVRETERAIGAEIALTSHDGEQRVTRLAWLPKSQCRQDETGRWLCPGWLIAAREQEIVEAAGGRGFIEPGMGLATEG